MADNSPTPTQYWGEGGIASRIWEDEQKILGELHNTEEDDMSPTEPYHNAAATGFDATVTGLGRIVEEALGPLPQVCQEQVILDLERARMTAEDYAHGNAVMNRYRDGAGVDGTETWRQMNRIHLRNMNEMNHTLGNIANAVTWHDHGATSDGIPMDDADCFEQIRAEVQFHGFLEEPSSAEDDLDSLE